LRRNQAIAERRARATAPAARLAAFLLAVLVAFSLSSFGAYAHAGSVGEAHAAIGHTDTAAAAPHGQPGHTHTVPCDEHDNEVGQDDCCMSASSCGLCVPVSSAGFAFGIAGGLAVPVRLSTSQPRDPPTLSHPPKLSVTA
jgi:hypothetical protein